MIKKHFSLRIGYQKGFTIVESLIGIFIVTLAITSATAMVQSSLQNVQIVRARAQASFLASEGIEYVRNLRDTEKLNGDVFLNGELGDFVRTCSSSGCSLDAIDGSYVSCTQLENCPLYLSDSGYGTNSSDYSTIFNRMIEVEEISIGGSNDEVKITSAVSFTVNNKTETVSLESHLMNF